MKPKVLVTGATGAIGRTLVETLLAADYPVRALVRKHCEILPAPVEQMQGNLTNSPSLVRAVADCTIVFHLAALLHINNPDPALANRYEEVNVLGTQALLAAAKAAMVERVVFFSSICVYGASDGTMLDESSPLNGETLYACSKISAETHVQAATNFKGEPLGVVLRLAAVYGSNMKGNYSRLANAIRRNRYLPIGKGANRRTLIYDRDVANVALLVASSPDAAGEIFNVTDGNVYPLRRIEHTIYSAYGKTVPPVVLPLPIVRGGVGMLGIFGRKSPAAMIDKYTEDVAVSGQKLQTVLGFQPHYSLNQGWQEIAANHVD